MAEINSTTSEAVVDTTITQANPTPKTEPKKEEVPETPSVQELMNEIAKLKRAVDKSSSEAADYKKKWKETLSQTEVATMEKAEEEARRDEQLKALMRENQINKLEKTYLGLNYTADEASRMAIAEADNDFDAKQKIMAEVDARKQKELEAQWLASRPSPSMGIDDAEDDPFLKGFNSVPMRFARK